MQHLLTGIAGLQACTANQPWREAVIDLNGEESVMRHYSLRKALIALLLCPLFISSGMASEQIDKEEYYSNRANALSDKDGSGTKSIAPLPVCRVEQHTDELSACFDAHGTIGNGYTHSGCGEPTSSFESPSSSGLDYLFSGAYWIGGIVGTDTIVSVGADGWHSCREFYPYGFDDPSSDPDWGIKEFDYVASQSYRTMFSDTVTDESSHCVPANATPLKISVTVRSHVFEETQIDKAVIYDMIITNIGDEQINKGYAGFYFDADVAHISNSSGFQDDITGSIRDRSSGSVIDNDGDPGGSGVEDSSPRRAFAFKLLDASFPVTDTSFNWWVSNGNDDLDFGPRRSDTTLRDYGTGGTGTPEGDLNKYHMMSFPEWDYDQFRTGTIEPDDPVWQYPVQAIADDIADGFDARFLMSFGPFELPPGASERILFATFTGAEVHIDSSNLQWLPDNPDLYYWNLSRFDLLETAGAADAKVPLLLDLLNPPIGFRFRLAELGQPDDRLLWDPNVYPGVTGYNVYRGLIPAEQPMPHPGTLPPWWLPDEYSLWEVLPETTSYSNPPYALDNFYYYKITQTSASGESSPTPPLILGRISRKPNPAMISNHDLFVIEPSPDPNHVTFEWTDNGSSVDHFNIYRFDSWAASQSLLHP
ncbi:MAG: hypothetical protein V3T31_00040, partial [candidate division Zixibacteria bacterium]